MFSHSCQQRGTTPFLWLLILTNPIILTDHEYSILKIDMQKRKHLNSNSCNQSRWETYHIASHTASSAHAVMERFDTNTKHVHHKNLSDHIASVLFHALHTYIVIYVFDVICWVKQIELVKLMCIWFAFVPHTRKLHALHEYTACHLTIPESSRSELALVHHSTCCTY